MDSPRVLTGDAPSPLLLTVFMFGGQAKVSPLSRAFLALSRSSSHDQKRVALVKPWRAARYTHIRAKMAFLLTPERGRFVEINCCGGLRRRGGIDATYLSGNEE